VLINSLAVLQAVKIAAGVAAILAIATGIFLLVVPRRLLQSDRMLGRSLLQINLGEPFNRRYAIERHVYRRHRTFGAIVIGGAIALLALSWFLATHRLALKFYAQVGNSAFRGLFLLAAALGVVLLAIGVCFVIRPSVLKGLETAANRWIQPGPAQYRHMGLAHAVARFPRATGALLLLAGLGCLAAF
jgi:hypothetical protein